MIKSNHQINHHELRSDTIIENFNRETDNSLRDRFNNDLFSFSYRLLLTFRFGPPSFVLYSCLDKLNNKY